MAEVNAWFKSNIQSPMHRNGITVTLRLVKVNNTLKKPGPVFLEMARAAYNAGADYFYRINDDTELMVNWPAKFVAGMQVNKYDLSFSFSFFTIFLSFASPVIDN